MYTTVLVLLLPLASGFAPAPSFLGRASLSSALSSDKVIFGGNEWKPEDGQMKATDTPDFFPDDYNEDDAPDFTEGMGGSQAKMGGGDWDGLHSRHGGLRQGRDRHRRPGGVQHP